MGRGETRAPARGQWARDSAPWGCRDWGRGVGGMGGADAEGPEQGWKVWRGALLLADYILSQRDLFRGRTVLELGAGTGLASILAATVAQTVYCTGNARRVRLRGSGLFTERVLTR
eukprot:bmy_02824T0